MFSQARSNFLRICSYCRSALCQLNSFTQSYSTSLFWSMKPRLVCARSMNFGALLFILVLLTSEFCSPRTILQPFLPLRTMFRTLADKWSNWFVQSDKSKRQNSSTPRKHIHLTTTGMWLNLGLIESFSHTFVHSVL